MLPDQKGIHFRNGQTNKRQSPFANKILKTNTILLIRSGVFPQHIDGEAMQNRQFSEENSEEKCCEPGSGLKNWNIV